MNDTVVSEKFIKGLRNIAESRPEQAEQMFIASGPVLKAYRAGALMGGVTLAQTLCDMLGVVYTDNLKGVSASLKKLVITELDTELANLKEQDNG